MARYRSMSPWIVGSPGGWAAFLASSPLAKAAASSSAVFFASSRSLWPREALFRAGSARPHTSSYHSMKRIPPLVFSKVRTQFRPRSPLT